jgi:hypothetical protein
MIGSDYLDNMSEAVELNVLEGDFYSTGEVPTNIMVVVLWMGNGI